MRPWHTWLIFAVCMAVSLAALGWHSVTILRLDRTETAAIRQAAIEERIRLALWRMDSALAPLIAQESAWPYFAYTSFSPMERAYTNMLNPIEPGEILVPSPLLDLASPRVLVHFQIDPDGGLSSPQVPTGPMRRIAENQYTTADKIDLHHHRLEQLRPLLMRSDLLARLDSPESRPLRMAALPPRETSATQASVAQPAIVQPAAAVADHRQSLDFQQRGNRLNQQIEMQQAAVPQRPPAQQPPAPVKQQKRSAKTELISPEQQAGLNTDNTRALVSNNVFNGEIAFDNTTNSLLLRLGVMEGITRPLWMGDKLLLARRAQVNGTEYVQGCWLDWPGISDWLLSEIRDLLPEASLEPIRNRPDPNNPRQLAALPIRLSPGDIALASEDGATPIRSSLLIAWACVILAVGAVIALLTGTVSLSERRAAFVSAVTHEMRTPLTTFRMYTEMLTGGMVPDETKRRRYLDTLRTEAERLSHLVENVLSYARLERNRVAAAAQVVSLGELLARIETRLSDRATLADMKLETALSPQEAELTVRVDASAVEQILFNLVDNACKYAVSATDRRIHVEVRRNGHVAVISVRDHGPGISRSDAKRLFRPFSKSAKDAAGSAPGVGLGLALSRRLARHMGGDLRLDPNVDDGACVTLELPLVS